jgi:hypothetical protein
LLFVLHEIMQLYDVNVFVEPTFFSFPVSIISGLFIAWLFISEFIYYLSVDVQPELFVDTSRGEKLRINMDVIFHNLPCSCKLLTYRETLAVTAPLSSSGVSSSRAFAYVCVIFHLL